MSNAPQPNAFVELVRGAWFIVVVALILVGGLVLYQMLDEGWWYVVPGVLILGAGWFVLLRNRARRRSG